jgi:hypothetical protein
MATVRAYTYKDELQFIHKDNYESRGKSVEKLIRESINRYNITKKFDFTISTDDVPHDKFHSFSTVYKNYIKAFPCFLYDAWPETGVDNYTDTILKFKDTVPVSNKVGWIGGGFGQIPVRTNFLNKFSNTHFSEGLCNAWNISNLHRLWENSKTYLSYQDQIDRWKYLLDMEGIGWSARTKVLLCSPRIVFIANRIFEEWWYEYLVPWKHYVPVRRDMLDLQENYERLEADHELQKYIKYEQQKFAQQYLTHDAALLQIKKVIENL